MSVRPAGGAADFVLSPALAVAGVGVGVGAGTVAAGAHSLTAVISSSARFKAVRDIRFRQSCKAESVPRISAKVHFSAWAYRHGSISGRAKTSSPVIRPPS